MTAMVFTGVPERPQQLTVPAVSFHCGTDTTTTEVTETRDPEHNAANPRSPADKPRQPVDNRFSNAGRSAGPCSASRSPSIATEQSTQNLPSGRWSLPVSRRGFLLSLPLAHSWRTGCSSMRRASGGVGAFASQPTMSVRTTHEVAAISRRFNCGSPVIRRATTSWRER